jgi:hypothetical protein
MLFLPPRRPTRPARPVRLIHPLAGSAGSNGYRTCPNGGSESRIPSETRRTEEVGSESALLEFALARLDTNVLTKSQIERLAEADEHELVKEVQVRALLRSNSEKWDEVRGE